ncbi:FGGY-family carbohydrate kinase [Cyanobium sp. Morenito 9A2]|uniref:FGGY-family carbohydrate kinase n=1 Tax=Cyanobium sp. Morenito 9A2 TaxID=2823718 RepID=UPI0020CEB3AF|nr:FGGY-family carbohydrate kinase [Cyanobium sp. Morenito 9A2]MCP9851168.1 sugar kinase [Cyanobium sp. Morenito 9A2]
MGASQEPSPDLALGIDLGSSGLRLALIDAQGTLLSERSGSYPLPFEQPEGWRRGLVELIGTLEEPLRARVGAIALDGTSGTLLLCGPDGSTRGPALPYHRACPEQAGALASLVPAGSAAASASGSLARALNLLSREGALDDSHHLLLRHQADWLMGWLLGHWRWGEEGNNLRLGWDLQRESWAGRIEQQPWSSALPEVVPSGAALGPLGPQASEQLGLPASCQVVSGTTDANAAVLAAGPGPGDGVSVLGTTLVLKRFVDAPLEGPGLTNHRVGGRWLVGGASNAGAGILRRFFTPAQIEQLSRQIDPRRPSGLRLRPLPAPGERFPVDAPQLEPVLEPRPISDALYLQALLEGLTAIEDQGWQRLAELGAPPLERVISLGGGARNPQWRLLRQRALGIPVLNRPGLAPALGTARLALGGWRMGPSLLPQRRP